MTMMTMLPAVDFAAGETTRELLWQDETVVHLTNYSAEAISDADETAIDTAFLGGRSLAALTRGDQVVCSEFEAPINRALVAYHNELGISTLRPQDVHGIPSNWPYTPICDDMVEFMKREPAAARAIIDGARYMVPFIGSPGSDALAKRYNLIAETTADAVNIANNKGYLPFAARDFGFLTPPTQRPVNLQEAERYFSELMQLGTGNPDVFEPTIWVKLCRSSGGEGVRSFTALQSFLEWINGAEDGALFRQSMMSRKFNEGIVLQLGIKGRALDAGPNINFYVGKSPEDDRDLGASAQAIENGSIHVGNKGMLNASDREKISPVISRVAAWLRSIGYRGVCGIDVIMGEDGRIWVIDVNARWNASTPTLMLFHNLRQFPGVKAFRYAGKVRVPARVSVQDVASWLGAQRVGFTPERGGVVPLNLMAAHRPDVGAMAYMNAAIFAPDHETIRTYFELAHMRPPTQIRHQKSPLP